MFIVLFQSNRLYFCPLRSLFGFSQLHAVIRHDLSPALVSHLFACLQKTVTQLKAELEKGPQEAAVYTQQIHQLQSSLNNLQQQSQVTLW